MAALLGMNLSPPLGVTLPSLPGVPSLEGDFLGVLDGVFLREVLNLFIPKLLPSLLGDFWRDSPTQQNFKINQISLVITSSIST